MSLNHKRPHVRNFELANELYLQQSTKNSELIDSSFRLSFELTQKKRCDCLITFDCGGVTQ